MISKSYAKINLSLDVIGKREDGYHILKMIMQNVELYDTINIKIIRQGIRITCNKPFIPTDNRNLAYKAAKLFIDTYNINSGVYIHINKNIPVAAGLAGGSSNAATVLKMMRDIFKPEISNDELCKLGVNIGADVPYCVLGGTALCEGIGEKITPIKSFKNHIVVLVKPNFGISTKEVYSNLNINKIYTRPNTNGLINSIEKDNLRFMCRSMKNILENVTLKKYRIIKEIKEEMIRYGALGSLMSGSGPSVFGVFDDMLKAQQCYDKMKSSYSEVFITRTI